MKHKRVWAILLVFILLTGCFPSSAKAKVEETERAAAMINENSDFAGHALLEVLAEDVRFGPLNYDPMYDGMLPNFIVPEGVLEQNSNIYGQYYKYPNDSNVFQLTWIFISVPDYHILGIHVGNTIDDAEKILSEHGFTLAEKGVFTQRDEEFFYASYGLYDIRVNLRTLEESQIIDSLYISVADPDEEELEGAY